MKFSLRWEWAGRSVLTNGKRPWKLLSRQWSFACRLYEEFSGGVTCTTIHEPLRNLYCYWPLMQMIRTLLSMRMLLILTYIICRNHFQGSGRSQALQGIFGRRDLSEDTRRSPKILHSYFVSFYVSPIL